MSYTGYASLAKFLLRFELIKTHLSLFRPILSSYRIILNVFRVFWAHLGLFTPVLAFHSFRLIYTVLSSFRLISVYLGSFRLLWLVLSSFDLRPFNLNWFQPVKYILEEITLINILLIRCKIYAAAVISLQFSGKKFKCINICFMITILFIFWRQCEILQRQFQIPLIFCKLFSTPLNKADLIIATQSKLLFESNYLKSITEGLSLQIHLCQTQVKLLALSSHITVDWRHQRCKCNIVYLKNSFIVSSFLFQFIHNIALLQGLVAITARVGVKNS